MVFRIFLEVISKQFWQEHSVGKQMFSDKSSQHWRFRGWQLLTGFSVPLFQKPLLPRHFGKAIMCIKYRI
jgi:hypothetical protein